MIAIDHAYSEEYKKAYAQQTDNSDELVSVFKKCQERLNEKLNSYRGLLIQIDEDISK